jgi:hypothetical protein
MITSFGADKDRLRQVVTRYRSEFAERGLDTVPTGELLALCGWLDDQLPDLQRRHRLAAAMDKQPRHQRMALLREPMTSTAKARAEGRALARRFTGNSGGTAQAGAAYHAMAQELAAVGDDPDFCSSFYAALPPVVLNALPADLAYTGSGTAKADLKAFSQAFATAVSTRSPAPGFEQAKKAFLQPMPEHGYSSWAWNRAALLAHGDFPPAFLATAARVNGLDHLAKNPHDPRQSYQGDRSAATLLGLPEDLVALDLQNLSRNGRAAFDAVAQMGSPKDPDLQSHLATLIRYGVRNSEAATALGAMMDTGAGVRGAYDKNGDWHVDASYKPDSYEQTFAYCAILATAGTKEALDLDGVFKSDMGRLAAAYAPEFATAGHQMNGYDAPDSSFGAPGSGTYHELPGLEPAFHLGGADTYRFLKVFAEQDAVTAPFDEAMAALRHQVMLKAAEADRASLLGDARGADGLFDASAKAFGNIARMEFDAMSEVREKMDEQSEAFREHLKAALILPSEVAGEPEWRLAGELVWRTGMWAAKEFALTSAISATAGSSMADYTRDKNLELTASQRYYAASILVEAGWPTTPIPADLRDEKGNLKPYEHLSTSSDPKQAEEERVEKIRDFDAWLAEQSLPVGITTFHKREEDASGLLANSQVDPDIRNVEEGD